MEFLANETLSSTLVPVLLGCSGKALQQANAFHREYGVLSHLFSDRIPLFYRLCPLVRSHRVQKTREDMLLLQALLDFAKQLENADRLLCLVPCTAFYQEFVSLHAKDLEGAFLLADRSTLTPKEGKE